MEDFNEVLAEFPQMRCQLEIVARERLAQLGKRTNVLETKSRLKHQDTAYGVALSTDDFQEIAEMANEETRKMVRRLSVMLESSEIWAGGSNSRGVSPSACECRRASAGHLQFGCHESDNELKEKDEDELDDDSTLLSNSGKNARTSLHMRIGSVSLGSLIDREVLEEDEEEEEDKKGTLHNEYPTSATTGSDSDLVLKSRRESKGSN